jgi:hypothetical protein
MKKIGISLFMLAAMLGMNAQAEVNIYQEIMLADLQASIAQERAEKNAINWRVGERSEYKMQASIGNLGDLKKRVDRAEGNAVWLITEMTGRRNEKTEAKIDRATGQILEYILNGQRQAPPVDRSEIVSQDEQTITVPAGTFRTIHAVVNTNQTEVKQVEVWVNTRQIVIDGIAKTIAYTSWFPVEIILQRFFRP